MRAGGISYAHMHTMMRPLGGPERVSTAITLAFALLASPSATDATTYHPRAAWMGECGWGITISLSAVNRDGPNGLTNRTITTVEEWNDLVNAFDVAALVAQLVELRTCWVFLCVGSVDGWFVAPNPVLDGILSIPAAESHSSRRNLIADLGAALKGTGIRLGVYLPSNPP